MPIRTRRIFTLAAGIVTAGVMNTAASTAHLPKEVEEESINRPDVTLTNFVSDIVVSSGSFVIEIEPQESTEPPRTRSPLDRSFYFG